MRSLVKLSVGAVAACLLSLWPVVSAAQTVRGDFDGDGFGDLAVGLPYYDHWVGTGGIGTATDTGAVLIVYGSSSGPAWWRSQTLTQNNFWFTGDRSESYDYFGFALASEDFDGDGFADLAVGVPGEDVGTIRDAGAVLVLYGSPEGLLNYRAQQWHSDSAGVVGTAEADDMFGWSLAAGRRFITQYVHGRAFLAIGAPYEDVTIRVWSREEFLTFRTIVDAGAVTVLYGLPSGVTESQEWHADSVGVPGTAEARDRFGATLAAGNFDGDVMFDLAIGIPGEDVGTIEDAGAVVTLFGDRGYDTGNGTGTVLAATWRSQELHENAPYVAGAAEAREHFGAALTAADFDGDGFDDLAIGVPGQKIGAVDYNAGAVVLVYGDYGLMTSSVELHSDVAGVAGEAETHDYFGQTLAAGDFNGDGYADLAVGVPREDLGYATVFDVGAVVVLYGSSSGVGARSEEWTQNHPALAGLNDGSEAQDQFGAALAAVDLNGDGRDDLIVGVPGENITYSVTTSPDGALNILNGSSAGLRVIDGRPWTNLDLALQAGQPGEGFGRFLSQQ